MSDDQCKQYIQERYEPALKYYDRRAIRNKRGHYICSVLVLIISVFVASAQGLPDSVKVIANILAPTIALLSGIAALYRFHQEWMSARTTWDALRHEKFWKDAGVGPYEGAVDKNELFVSRVESLIDKEGTEWRSRQAAKLTGPPDVSVTKK